MQAKMEQILREWIAENAHRFPYDVEPMRGEMVRTFGTWQSEAIARLVSDHTKRRLHRRTVSKQVGSRAYSFQIYHEKNQIDDFYMILFWAYEPIYGRPVEPKHLLGHLSEATMRIAWAHFKRQVQNATPEREVPFGHAGDTWDFHKAWDRALTAARFFDRTKNE